MTLVIAHRGASGYRPENTLAAFELAVEQRADMIEVDLHLSADGVVLIRHDAELESLGGRGEIADLPAARIRELDAGGGQPVPTLDEVLDRFGARIDFNLELKPRGRSPYPGLEGLVLAAVEKRGLLGRTLFSSFADPVLERLRALSERARIGVLVSPRSPGDPLERARALAADSVHPWIGMAEAGLVERAHAEGLAVHVFTVNEPEDMRRLRAMGVNGMFTDYPDRLRALAP